MRDTSLGNIDAGTLLYTDEHPAYMAVENVRKIINHLEGYVKENIHTNGIEIFWSLCQLGGTYISVEPFHRFRYLDRQAFRLNTRKDDNGRGSTDGERFAKAMSRVDGRRSAYAQLTGNDQSPRHESTGTGTAQEPF